MALYLDGKKALDPLQTALNLNNQGNSNGWQFMRDLFKSVLILTDDQDTWDNAVDGSGSVAITNHARSARTGTTAGSTAVLYTNPIGLGYAGTNQTRVNWDKALLISFSLVITAGASDTFGYVLLHEGAVTVAGCVDPTAKAIGIKIANLALQGLAYDTALATIALQTLTAGTLYAIDIVHTPAVSVEWFVNGVSKGTSTREPSGLAGAYSRFAVMMDNAAQVIDYNLDIMNLVFVQAK